MAEEFFFNTKQEGQDYNWKMLGELYSELMMFFERYLGNAWSDYSFSVWLQGEGDF